MLALVILMMMGTGCILSLQPFYTPDSIVTRPDLPGRWTSEDGKAVWNFEPGEDGHYLLTIRDEQGRRGAFEATLSRLGDQLYIDLYPDEPENESTLDFYKLHLMPVHTFYRVYLDDKLFTLDYINEDWMEKYLRKYPDSLGHAFADDELLITASPEDIRSFCANNLDPNASFENFAKLKKAD